MQLRPSRICYTPTIKSSGKDSEQFSLLMQHQLRILVDFRVSQLGQLQLHIFSRMNLSDTFGMFLVPSMETNVISSFS
jgi:hypothetical protein